MKIHCTTLLFVLALATSANGNRTPLLSGPILYGILSDGQLYKIDVMNCTACPIADLNVLPPATDVLVLPNGDILVQANGLRRYSLPGTDPVWTNETFAFEGSILAPDGTVYLTRTFPSAGLSTYDPATNTVTFIGEWPAGMSLSEFFYQDGILYAFGGLNFTGVAVEVNTTDPSLSTVVQSGIALNTGGATNDGYTTMVGGSSTTTLNQYDVNSDTYTFVCDLASFTGGVGFTGLSVLPTGIQEAPCLCATFAGTVTNQTFNICVPGSVTTPYNNNATLVGTDILRYILFSNTSDTLGSIIVQSSSPTIAFNEAIMQTGITYYLATIAGDNLGGNVDLDDPCLDISNVAAQVIWREEPAVVFSIQGDPEICAGACRTILADFTGSPPFALTYTTPFGTFNASFSSQTGTFQVCIPATAQPGALSIQAASLSDAWCDCN